RGRPWLPSPSRKNLRSSRERAIRPVSSHYPPFLAAAPAPMNGQSFVDRLKQEFGDKITGADLEAIDPWVVVSPDGLVEICTFLRDEPDLRFNFLNCISGVDYFEADPKKAAKTGWQPHTEVVYHLWSVPNKVSLVLKV